MKKLHVIAMADRREELLKGLLHLGCVEISEPPEADGRSDAPPGDWEGPPAALELRTPDGSALDQAREEKQSAERALSVLARHGAKGRGMLTPRPQLTEEELFEPGTQAVEAVLRKDREAALLQTEQGKLTAQKAALAPWLSLDLPLESGSTREMLVQFGTLTAARPLEEAQRAVEGASELAQLIQASAWSHPALSSYGQLPAGLSQKRPGGGAGGPAGFWLVQGPIERLDGHGPGK